MKNIFVLLFVLGLGVGSFASQGDLASAIQAYRQRQADATPASVLSWLKEGNQRFVAGHSTHGGFPVDARFQVQVTAPAQKPLAVVLSCIDSRTTPELVFDVSVGDLFTTRAGANVISNDILGSLEISAASGAKVIVVLGHKDCGGVKGACSGLTLGHATAMLAKVKPAIEATHAKLDADSELAKEVGPRDVKNRRYIAEVSHMNVLNSVAEIKKRSPVIRKKIESGEVILVPAIYDVDSGKVIFL